MEYFAFLTIISDVQEGVNSRPLTYSGAGDATLEMITPNSFLKLTSSNNLSFGSTLGSDLIMPTRADLLNMIEVREKAMSRFRDLYYSEYLVSLRDRKLDNFQPVWEDRVKEGDVVLVHSPVKARPFWSMARKVSLVRGKDQRVRSVRVMRPDRATGEYAISLLYPLEIHADRVRGYTNPLQLTNNVDKPKILVTRRSRPQRQAALKCKDKIKTCV
jgi:hypothetical protein